MMFWFRKSRHKKKEEVTWPALCVDVHSHLIPGIDDGARCEEESLALLRGLERCGYRKVWTTPHIMSDVYRNDVETIEKGLQTLRELARREGVDLSIDAAAEYYLDEGFTEKMKAKKVMAIDEKYVLFETSYMSKPLMTEEMIFAIGTAGYIPLFAHPERYRYVEDPEKEYGRFKELGVLFQVNINSFGGYYGKTAQRLAEFLEERGMIDFLGSDAHRPKHTETLYRLLKEGIVDRIRKRNDIKNDRLMEA